MCFAIKFDVVCEPHREQPPLASIGPELQVSKRNDWRRQNNSRSGSSRGKKGFPRPEREAPRHPRATSRGIVQQHFPGPRSHSMNFAGLRSTQVFLTHLPRTQPPISVSHPACARGYELRGSSLLSVVSPLKLKQLRSQALPHRGL